MYRLRIVFQRVSLDSVVYLILCLVTLVSAFGPLIYLYMHAPQGTQYRFADGFFYDYYHYLMKIQSGMMGKLGYYNRYTEVVQPVSYGHAIFALIGYVSAAFGVLRPDIAFLFSRIITLSLLFVALYQSVRRLFSSTQTRIVAFVLFITGTSGYTISHSSYGWRAVEPITFSGFYNALQKFPAPPQHLLASTLLLLIGSVAFQSAPKKMTQVFIGAGAFLIGMLQPFISVVGILSVWIVVLYEWMLMRRKSHVVVHSAFIFTLSSIIPLWYYANLFQYVMPWKIWASTTFGYNYSADFMSYIVANSMYAPFVVIAICIAKKTSATIMFYLVWGSVVPTLLYPFAAQGMLVSLPRLLQIQQYIPLSIVSAYVIQQMLVSVGRNMQRMIVFVLCITAILFALLPWKTTIADSLIWKQPSYYNVFIPNDFIDALTYLNTYTPQESVVLTGEYMSAVIPAFTHNRVILGRGDITNDYDSKLQGMYAMFGPSPDASSILEYLRRYHISYVLFGVDTPVYAGPYLEYSFLQPVFTKGLVVITKVLR